MCDLCKPGGQGSYWVPSLQQALMEKGFHMLKTGWQCVGNSIPEQLSLDKTLKHTWPMERVIGNMLD